MLPSVIPVAFLLGLFPQVPLAQQLAVVRMVEKPAPLLEDSRAVGLSEVAFTRSTLPRWQQVTARYQRQSSQGGGSWSRLVTRLKAMDASHLLEKANALVNRARYVPDPRNWKVPDYWATPQELLAHGGDCEDYAIAKYLLLREIGVDATRMHVAVGMGHAFLLVMTDAGIVVLDNQNRHVRPLQPRDLETIVYTMNEVGWSVNVGAPPPQQRYAGGRPAYPPTLNVAGLKPVQVALSLPKPESAGAQSPGGGVSVLTSEGSQ